MTTLDPDAYRDPDLRIRQQFDRLRDLLASAAIAAPALARQLGDTDPAAIGDIDALARLPVLRKSDLIALQAAEPPFGGLTPLPASAYDLVHMSPGPIFEPAMRKPDWWRFGRFLRALGVGAGDMVQNCFSYHLTPAGMMMESAATALGATVIPAGTGQTEQQVAAAAALRATVYAGTPDYLRILLDQADEAGLTLAFDRAAVSGGALFASLREAYAERGITCRQCYGTADLGLVAYESEALEGMIVDEEVIVEVVRPGTGDRVADGEVGELLVTSLNPDYPLLRFATGDLTAILPGQSPCGRTNARIAGWMGRADQAAKVKGMFIRPEQVAELSRRLGAAGRIRVEVDREDEADRMTVKVEAANLDPAAVEALLPDILKLRGRAVICPPGSLPNDGKVIDDLRSYDTA